MKLKIYSIQTTKHNNHGIHGMNSCLKRLNFSFIINFRNRKQSLGMDMSGIGQEPILPAVLEFPETHQESFLHQVISDLDVNIPNFRLAPVYSLYLCARYFLLFFTFENEIKTKQSVIIGTVHQLIIGRTCSQQSGLIN